MKKLLFLIIVVSLITGITASETKADIYYPSADAYVMSGEGENTNYGSEGELYVNGEYGWSYLKFDLSSIPSGSIVASASLNLYETTGQSDSTIRVYQVIEDWSESEVTFNNSPNNGSSVLASTTVPGDTQFSYVSWSDTGLTDLIEDWINGTEDNYGLVLKSETALYTNFRSREYSGTDYDPYLEIEITEIPEPTSMILLGSLATGLFGVFGIRRKFAGR